jgi:hypothetical protein
MARPHLPGRFAVEGRSSAAKVFGFDGFALIPVKVQAMSASSTL